MKMRKIAILLASILLVVVQVAGQGFYEYMNENTSDNFIEITSALDAFYSTHNKGKGSGFKQYMRWKDDARNYLGTDGSISNKIAKTSRAFDRYLRSPQYQQAQQSTQRSTHGTWTQEGPTSYSGALGANGGLGRVSRVAFHPVNPNIVYACTPAGGLWKSSNNGSSWQVVTDKLPRVGAAGYTVDPFDINKQYLLTGDGDARKTPSIGVLKSIDGGTNWQPTDLTWKDSLCVGAYKLIMHPTNPSILFVASSVGLHRTTDGGINWSLIMSGTFTDVEFMPTNPTIMYATSKNDFFRSTNTGQSFVLVNDLDFPTDFKRIEIAVTPADSSVVYLLFGGHVAGTGNSTFSGLFRSSDFGVDFVLMSNTPNILGWSILADDSTNQGGYDLCIAAHPTNADQIYIGGINNWRSNDQGSTWQLLSHWAEVVLWPYVHGDIHDLVFKGNVLYCANDGGLYTLNTSNGVWTDITAGMCIMQSYDIDVFDNKLLTGTQDNGTNKWTIGSSNATFATGGDGFDCMYDQSNSGTYYTTWQGGVWRTDIDLIVNSINVPGYGSNDYWYNKFLMHPQDNDTIYFGIGQGGDTTKEVFRSFNRGGAWTNLQCGIGGGISALIGDPQNPDRVYVASGSLIRRTNNVNAASPLWASLAPLPGPTGNITDVVVDPNNSARLIVSVNQYWVGKKIYESVDTGATWVNISGSLPNVPFFCLLMDDNATDGGIYAGSDIGMFYRNNNMSDWIFFSNDLPVTPVRDLDIDNGILYAGTFGRGVWSSALYSQCAFSYSLTQTNSGNGTKVYHSSGFITSSQIIQGGIGTDFTYHSEGEITLLDGFHAKQYSTFEAKLKACPD
jgi:hypothetical protein